MKDGSIQVLSLVEQRLRDAGCNFGSDPFAYLCDDYSPLCLFLILSPNKYCRMQFLFLFCFFFLSVNCCEFL